MVNTKEKIINIAEKLHIDCIGFASVKPLENMREILSQRQEKDYLSGFEEKDIEKRINPLQVWEDAKSIIAIGISYHQEEPKYPEQALYGKISKSAWGTDYHKVLISKMEELMEAIQKEIMPLEYRTFVDTGPLVDREIAFQAGLGSYGKNGFIINPQFGSWLFIGNILVNIEIEEDSPLEKTHCGYCNLCIKNCPTKAIEGPFHFNAKKCISYLTQKKGILTDEERKVMGQQVYGCDICQQICPQNRNAPYGKNNDFKTTSSLAFPHLKKILKMSNQDFKTTYKSTAAGWRGKKILQRNSIIALGNSMDEKAIPILEEQLKDSRWEIRLYTIWALGQIDNKGRKRIKKWYPQETHPEVIEEILRVLEKDEEI